MLPDQVRQLLSAYVDGEVSNRQRKAVFRLLRRSAEARALLRRLQEDAERVRRLPPRRLPDDFPARVLLALPPRPSSNGPARPVLARGTVPLWGGLVAAAAVLLAVALGSFLFFHRAPDGTTSGEPVARVAPGDGLGSPDSGRKPADPPDPDDPPRPPEGPGDEGKPEPIPVPPVERPGGSGDPAKPGNSVPTAPSDPPVPRDDMEMFKPAVPQIDLFPLLTVREIEADKVAKLFEKDPAYRLELPCRDTRKGFRRLEAALKDTGFALLIDKAAQNRLADPRVQTNYVVFLEDVTPQELGRVLARLGAEDKKAAEAKPKPDPQFSKLVVNRLSDADRKEMFDLFGADTKPAANGSAPRPKPERTALAVTYNPVRPPAGSAEVKRYFETRKPVRPGAVQVLLVLRETPG
jgi:hypothetical protein